MPLCTLSWLEDIRWAGNDGTPFLRYSHLSLSHTHTHTHTHTLTHTHTHTHTHSLTHTHTLTHTLTHTHTQVQGFPTIKSWPSGKKSANDFEDYNGGRTTSDIVQWVMERWTVNLPPPEIHQVCMYMATPLIRTHCVAL